MNLFKHIEINDDQELYIVGDLHGCYDLYKKGMHRLGVRDEDVVISLGDLTDRGDQNFRCVLEFTRKKNRHAIRGNHEDMMIRGMLEGSREYYQCWYQNGGWTVWNEMGEEGVTMLASMLEDLPVVLTVSHRGKTYGFIHAGYPSVFEHLPITEIPNLMEPGHQFSTRGPQLEKFAEALMWDRDMVTCAQEGMQLPKVLGVDYVFHGHSYVPEPLINGNRVYMDTGGVFNNNLTFAYFDNEGELQFYSTLEED